VRVTLSGHNIVTGLAAGCVVRTSVAAAAPTQTTRGFLRVSPMEIDMNTIRVLLMAAALTAAAPLTFA
jgi:hypothetical protein